MVEAKTSPPTPNDEHEMFRTMNQMNCASFALTRRREVTMKNSLLWRTDAEL